MPSEKIKLKNALEDSPQIQAQLAKLEESIAPMKDCTILLRDTFQACSLHQQKVCEGTDALSKLLSSFQEDTFSEDDSFLSGAFSRLGRYLSELHSCQDMLSTQLQNAVIELLSQFISKDFSELDRRKENYDATWQEHEQAVVKFSRVSKKKDTEKTRFEANSDLFTARKKHYESCLDYLSKLNGFKLKWKYSLLEPLLTYMHAQMAYFKVGHEVLNKDLGKVLNELNTEVQKIHGQHQQDIQSMAEEREEVELTLPTRCLPDPDPTDPFVDYHPPKTNISSKSGYLFMRISKSGFISQWDRGYFYTTKKGYLYSHFPQKPPEIVLHMKAADANVADIDDRRYVFQITHTTLKRPIHLLAESEVERDEWIATIKNCGQEKNSTQTSTTSASKDPKVIKLERERIRSWVKKEIHEPPKKDKSNTKTPRTTTTSSQGLSLPILSSSNKTSPGTATMKKSPVLQRKSNRQKRSETIIGTYQPQLPVTTQPSPMSSPPSLSQLPSPLQPERVQAPQLQVTSPVGLTKKFYVKYLGHTEVEDGKNPSIVTETIRKVTTARSLQNVRSALQIEMTVTPKSIEFMNLSTKKAIGQIQLKGVIRCSTQPDNPKLLGIVNRTFSESDKPRFICHVLENDSEGSKICKIIDEAVQTAKMSSEQRQQSTATNHKRSVSANTPISNNTLYSQVKGNTASAQPPKDFADSGYVPNLPPPGLGTVLPMSQPSLFDPVPDQRIVTTATLSTTTAPHKSASASDLSSMNDSSLAPPTQSHPPGTASLGSSRSSSLDYLTMDTLSTTDQGPYAMTDSTFTDTFVTDDDESSFTTELELPPLNSPDSSQPAPGFAARTIDSDYITDSLFEIDSPDIVTPKLNNEVSSSSGYFPMPQVLTGTQKVQSAESTSQSIGGGASGSFQVGSGSQPTSGKSSDYYQGEQSYSVPATASQQISTASSDYFQQDSSFAAFGMNTTSITSSSSPSIFSLSPGTVNTSVPSSTALNSSSGYRAPQGNTTVPNTISTSFPGKPVAKPWETFTTCSVLNVASSSTIYSTAGSSNVDEVFDLGEPVDLLGDLSDPMYTSNSTSSAGFQSTFSGQSSSGYNQGSSPFSSVATTSPFTQATTSSVSPSAGYMSATGTLPSPLMPTPTSYGSNANGMTSFNDDEQDWLPPLPDDTDLLFGGQVPTSYGGSFVTQSTSSTRKQARKK